MKHYFVAGKYIVLMLVVLAGMAKGSDTLVFKTKTWVGINLEKHHKKPCFLLYYTGSDSKKDSILLNYADYEVTRYKKDNSIGDSKRAYSLYKNVKRNNNDIEEENTHTTLYMIQPNARSLKENIMPPVFDDSIKRPFFFLINYNPPQGTFPNNYYFNK